MNGIGTTLLIVLILLTYVFARSLDATRIHVPDKRDSFCGEHVQAKYCRADFGKLTDSRYRIYSKSSTRGGTWGMYLAARG